MFRPLTISIAPGDSLNQVQTELASIAEKLTTTPADVLLEDLIGKAIAFGLKVLAALVYNPYIHINRKLKPSPSAIAANLRWDLFGCFLQG